MKIEIENGLMKIEVENEAEASAIRWLERELNEKQRLKPVSLAELQQIVANTPQFWTDEVKRSYREGFEDGFDFCIQQFRKMNKKGFSRAREIINILRNWSNSVLKQWRVWGQSGLGEPAPAFDHESWSTIRSRILERDGACVECGDTLALEVDHIVEVREGGLPVDENLRTLCASCHRGVKS